MSSLFVALCSLVASSFRTRTALQAEILALRTNSPFSKRTRHLVCDSSAPTDCCGSCSRRIIHPFHPLSGKQFDLIEYRRLYSEGYAWVHDDCGQLRIIPTI